MLTKLPTITAGTTLEYKRLGIGYKPADGWTYSLHLQATGYVAADVAAEADGYAITLTATATAALAPGLYKYSERVSRTGVVRELASGSILIRPDVSKAGDGLTHAARTLGIIEAAIEGRLVDGIENYSIAGRAVSKMPIAELVKLRDTYKVQVYAERRAAAGLAGPTWGAMLATFPGPQTNASPDNTAGGAA